MRLSAFFLLLFFFAAVPAFTQDHPQPAAELVAPAADPNTYDFGQVREGSVQRHSFVLENKTAKVLTIKDTSTSCGCTASVVKDKTLKPGESTQIEVKFNSRGYSGQVKQFVYVATDDLDNPVVRYIIKADVVK
ncbi:MAG: hypothetical protein A3G38_01675 [Omnitrophica WOR_2 bacterium RIFCSPLOWO2_12_FULL_51_8]|nr:MAG: hypothetical protein A3G38_01675 [Omnitrophica WOR_2 bacterium RIFCSPLOWO2_12_FULL_51_8]